MSVRRQLISDELRYSHQTSPRKSRTYRGSSLFQPTIFYNNRVYNASPTGNNWLGKRLIPWNGELISSYIRSVQLKKNDTSVVSEFEIANHCKSNSYRIIYVLINSKNQIFMKSKPSIDYVPSRMNIMLTPDNIIRKIAYF